MKPDFPEFDGDESNYDVVIPGDDCSFAYGCSHNSKGKLVAATKMVHFGWTNGSDEPSFEWLVELHDGRFLHVEGWHDYTGWDCQSGVSVCAVGATLAEVAAHLTDDPRRVYAEQAKGQGA